MVGPGKSDYTAEILSFRQRKDEHFASGRGPIRDVSAFGGLHYYPPDPAWRFELPLLESALLPPSPDQHGEFVLDTTTGEPRHMALLGSVELPSGERLSVFGPLGEEQPARGFIPFRDATSGRETYGAGRYIDAPLGYDGPQTTVTADFNLAYHPYCAYSDGWTCPLPPPQNTLRVAVRAGEKLGE